MRRLVSMACIGFALCSPALADEPLLGKDVKTGPAGAPFCSDKDKLQEYILAAVKQDEKWMESLDDCATFKGGLKVAIIEDYPGSEIGHVVKVRVFGNNGSAVGYMLSLGLEAK